MQDLQLTADDFDFIRELINTHSGINLAKSKKDMVYSRLSRRIRLLNLNTFSDYCEILKQNQGNELTNMVNALTTNLTSFFREQHHFDYLSKKVLPELLIRNEESKRLRLWSAGCSTGEEPYSLAIAVNEFMQHYSDWDVKILATDIDTDVLQCAANGVYPVDRIKNIPMATVKRYFKRGSGKNEGLVKVSKEISSLITFKQLNLISTWPMQGIIDVIFCRNVLIYFTKETQRQIFMGFFRRVPNYGYLFIGHSETMHPDCKQFQLIGNTVYRKVVYR